MLKALGIAALAATAGAAGVVAYAATQPDTFMIARSVTITAPPENIFPLINDLHAMNTWNPFAKVDPAAVVAYSGPNSGKGAAYDWNGNSNAGKGRIEITGTQAPAKVTMNLHMIEPMDASNTVNFTLEPAGSATKVTWAMGGTQPLIGKIMNLFIDCDRMVGGEFEKGLAELKAAAEKS